MTAPTSVYPGRCTTHHGCKCREWANARLPQAETALAEALELLARASGINEGNVTIKQARLLGDIDRFLAAEQEEGA